MTQDSCLTALPYYLSQVGQLAETIVRVNRQSDDHFALEFLEKLQFQVDVDVASRTDPDERDQLSEIEATVFEPMLRKIQLKAQRSTSNQKSAEGQPAVIEIEGLIRDAIVVATH